MGLVIWRRERFFQESRIPLMLENMVGAGPAFRGGFPLKGKPRHLNFLVDASSQFLDAMQRDPVFVGTDVTLVGKVAQNFVDAFA